MARVWNGNDPGGGLVVLTGETRSGFGEQCGGRGGDGGRAGGEDAEDLGRSVLWGAGRSREAGRSNLWIHSLWPSWSSCVLAMVSRSQTLT